MSRLHHDILRSSKVKRLRGTIFVPGDKSISHRALIIGSLAIGETRISGLLEGADVQATKNALIALGADVQKTLEGDWQVIGVGLGGMISPSSRHAMTAFFRSVRKMPRIRRSRI